MSKTKFSNFLKLTHSKILLYIILVALTFYFTFKPNVGYGEPPEMFSIDSGLTICEKSVFFEQYSCTQLSIEFYIGLLLWYPVASMIFWVHDKKLSYKAIMILLLFVVLFLYIFLMGKYLFSVIL